MLIADKEYVRKEYRFFNTFNDIHTAIQRKNGKYQGILSTNNVIRHPGLPTKHPDIPIYKENHITFAYINPANWGSALLFETGYHIVGYTDQNLNCPFLAMLLTGPSLKTYFLIAHIYALKSLSIEEQVRYLVTKLKAKELTPQSIIYRPREDSDDGHSNKVLADFIQQPLPEKRRHYEFAGGLVSSQGCFIFEEYAYVPNDDPIDVLLAKKCELHLWHISDSAQQAKSINNLLN